MKKDINTRADARTSDVIRAVDGLTSYNFPELGVTVEAADYQEALEKAKKVYKETKI
jgi:hypothetical protein